LELLFIQVCHWLPPPLIHSLPWLLGHPVLWLHFRSLSSLYSFWGGVCYKGEHLCHIGRSRFSSICFASWAWVQILASLLCAGASWLNNFFVLQLSHLWNEVKKPYPKGLVQSA
jgi:hypothetical protein